MVHAVHEVHEVRRDFPNKRLGGGMDTMRIRLKFEFFEKGLVKCDTSRCI